MRIWQETRWRRFQPSWRATLLATAIAGLISGCSGPPSKAWNSTGTATSGSPATPAMPPPTAATVKLMTPTGELAGQAILTTMPTGVEIALTANGLTPGQHGFRFYTNGACSPGPDPATGKRVDFGAAGSPFAPANAGATGQPPPGRDGELPNLTADASGKASARYLNTEVTLTPGQTSVIGRVLVVHATAQRRGTDQPQQGDVAGRVLCGLIVPAQVESVVGRAEMQKAGTT